MAVYQIVFSPTGGTEKAARCMAKEFCQDNIFVDLCSRDTDFAGLLLKEEDICLVAVPSYGGRVPGLAVSRLRQIKGNSARAVLIAVYGNRAYEDTLVELRDVLEEAGFSCVAAVAAVAEHSIMRQFAAGRPDGEDEKELAGFAAEICSGLDKGTLNGLSELPGDRPYRTYDGVPMKPRAGKACNRCGLCVRACPAAAIPEKDPSRTDSSKCISCMRCIAVCPGQARSVSKALLAAGSMKLKKACGGRKENELFL